MTCVFQTKPFSVCVTPYQQSMTSALNLIEPTILPNWISQLVFDEQRYKPLSFELWNKWLQGLQGFRNIAFILPFFEKPVPSKMLTEITAYVVSQKRDSSLIERNVCS